LILKNRRLQFMLAVLALIFVYEALLFAVSHGRYSVPSADGNGVALRAFPYPYRCAFTICSDIDGTGSLREFLVIQEYLNTRNETVLGQGLGLEIGNSFYGVTKDEQLGFISQDSVNAEVISELVGMGYVDVIHSFAYAEGRAEIAKTVQALVDRDCRLDVWVNHSRDSSNVGRFSSTRASSLGDNIGSGVYHTDFSLPQLGLRFFWIGDVSAIVGQGRPVAPAAFFSALDRGHKLDSFYNCSMKELVKFSAAPFTAKYSARIHNDLIWPGELEDGQRVFFFSRCNISHKQYADVDGLAENLRPEVLRALVEAGGYMVVYTHLGMNGGYPYLTEEACRNLEKLAARNREGEVLVATTGRLLNYYANTKYLNWHSEVDKGGVLICIDSISDPVRGEFVPSPEELRGVTFYVKDPRAVHMDIGGKRCRDITMNPADHTGRASVMVPWAPLASADSLMSRYKRRGFF